MGKWRVVFKENYGQGGGRYTLEKEGSQIDVSYSRHNQQGFAGSNQVNVFVGGYGGWSLGTPRNFRTVQEVNRFVAYAKRELSKKKYGRQVAFPM